MGIVIIFEYEEGGAVVTNFLLRTFVKDYENTEAPAVRSAVGSFAGITGIVCNLLLFVCKLLAGIVSGAVSVVADSLNNLTDAASSVVTLLGFYLGKRPADADHPYGHARYEYISGLAVSAIILLIGVELAEGSIRRIFNPTPVSETTVVIIVLLASIAVKLWMFSFFRNTGKCIQSSVLKAASIDSRNDVLASGAVLLGCLIDRGFSVNLDGYIGLAVALFIICSGIGVAKETISPLLGQRADQELVDKINAVILSNDKVLGLHDLLVHDYGPGQCFASVHVEINAEENPLDCHDAIDCIERKTLEMLGVHLVIHYDPVVQNDTERQEMLDTITEVIGQLDDRLSVHDLRIVREKGESKLVFDLVVPYDKCNEHKALKTAIDDALKSRGKAYKTVVHFDNTH